MKLFSELFQTFRDLKEHDPRVSSIVEDQKTLLELKQKVTQELEVGVELINDHFIRYMSCDVHVLIMLLSVSTVTVFHSSVLFVLLWVEF